MKIIVSFTSDGCLAHTGTVDVATALTTIMQEPSTGVRRLGRDYKEKLFLYAYSRCDSTYLFLVEGARHTEEAVTVASTQAPSFFEAVNQYLYPPSKPPETLFEGITSAAGRLYHDLQHAINSGAGITNNTAGFFAAITDALTKLSHRSPTTPDPSNDSANTLLTQYLTSLNSFDPATLIPTLLAVFLASFLISRPGAMASRWGFGSNWAGRFSPFTRSPASGGEVADSAFSYITSEDLKRNNVERSHGDDDDDDAKEGEASHRDHHHHHKHSHSRDDSHGRDTDMLVLKNKRQAYPVHFPALSIDRGELHIRDIRSAAGKKMGQSASSIKMFYKGRNLKDDGRQARDEGLSSGRQSELLCVVGDAPIPGDEDEDDEEEEDVDGFDDSPAGDSAGKKKKRKNRKKKPRRSDQGGSPAPTAASSAATPSASATFIPPSHIPAPVSRSSASTPAPASQTPQTPVDKIKVLFRKFESEFLPLCEAYVSSPPADKAKRDFEHKKLTETIMGQILLKLDGVETEGDQEARTKRKEAVKEVNGWLSRLDKVQAA